MSVSLPIHPSGGAREVVRIRERFSRHLLFEPTDRPPYWETILFWDETIRRWHNEGLPPEMSGEEYFEMETLHWIPEVPIIWIPFFPCFEVQALQEAPDYRIVRNSYGIVLKEYRLGESIPQFLEFPVRDRADWEALAWRLNADNPDRYEGILRKAAGFNTRAQVPRCHEICPLPICGGYGFLRNLFGEVNLAYALYDQPELICEMMEKWLEFYCRLSTRLTEFLSFDFVYLWDDMSYKNGPLISPEMVRKYLVPYYRELIQHHKSLGYRLFLWDSDGDPRSILPLMVSTGVNSFLPCEITSGTEPLPLQERYGRSLSLCGGIDKRALTRKKSDIYEEVMRKVPGLLRHGGYIPAIDHGVPSDVPFENYCYFVELVRGLGREIPPQESR